VALAHDFASSFTGKRIEMSDPVAAPRVPGRFWYVIAAVLFFGSIIAPAPVVLWNVFAGSDETLRLIAPDQKKFRLTRGSYTVFSDSRAVVDGEIITSQGSISGLRLRVRSADGKEIPVEAVSIASRYSVGGQTGFAILQFSIPESGDYVVAAEYREKSTGNRALLSIRKEFLGGLIGSILLAVFLSFAGAFLGVAIFLRTLWKRKKLIVGNIRMTARDMEGHIKQAVRNARHSTPGSSSSAAKSPVEHQYERDK
jgi:hypothetical protein